jgi:hypothetical protein
MPEWPRPLQCHHQELTSLQIHQVQYGKHLTIEMQQCEFHFINQYYEDKMRPLAPPVT